MSGRPCEISRRAGRTQKALTWKSLKGRVDSHPPNPEGEGFGGYGLAKTADEEGEPEIREIRILEGSSMELMLRQRFQIDAN